MGSSIVASDQDVTDPTMAGSGVSLLLWLLAFQLTLYAVAWGVCSLLLRESRRAVAHWGAFLLLTGLGFALVAGRGEPRSWLYYNGANLLTMVGLVTMRRGTERFMHVPSSDREQALAMLPLAALIALVGPGEDAAPLRIVVVYAAQAYAVLRTMWTTRRALVQEFGRPAVVATLIPGIGIGLAMLMLAAAQLWHWPRALEMQQDSPANLGLGVIYLGGAALFNIGFMVMLTLRLVVSLREASQLDPLTGLFNRRAVDQALDLAWQRFGRSGQPLAVMVVDIDHFKRINDTKGHAAGDAVLVGLAGLLQRQLRAVDTVGRIGGEEFLLVLPGTTETQAVTLAERLRTQVLDSTLGTTISIGVAEARTDDVDIGRVVERADAALYRAKASGRNRVERPGEAINPARARSGSSAPPTFPRRSGTRAHRGKSARPGNR